MSQPLTPTFGFILLAAELLHRHGTPSHRLERVMAKVSVSLGVKGVFLYTPTALIVSLDDGSGEQTFLRRVDGGPVDADKLWRFDDILEHLEDGKIGVDEATRRLNDAASAEPIYNWIVTVLACVLSCAAVAVLFGGGAWELSMAGFWGGVVALLELVVGRWKWERGTFEPLAGAIVGAGSLTMATFWQPFDYHLTTLAALIVLLPGLTLTIALTELAVGHLSAGVARLAGACVTLLTLVMGVAMGWHVSRVLYAVPLELDGTPLVSLPGWANWLALAIAPATFSILFRVRVSQWPVIYVVSVGGVLMHNLTAASMNAEVAAFVGALTVGCCSNLYARWRDRPALIPSTPGIIILVPGSLGYRSLTALLERHTVEGVAFAFSTMLIAASLVGGLLAAGVLVPPRRLL
jgi:uncharacterized membrane protein YjjP (DUF1212 family)